MPVYELRFTDGRPAEQVVADRWESQGTALVFTSSQLVMNRPRDVVARRVPAGEVQEVRLASVSG